MFLFLLGPTDLLILHEITRKAPNQGQKTFKVLIGLCFRYDLGKMVRELSGYLTFLCITTSMFYFRFLIHENYSIQAALNIGRGMYC